MAIDEERKAKIKLTQEQLERVCERHKRFMEGRPNGSRANMPFFDLSGLDFSGRNLTGAHLSGAILRDARMIETVLDHADLFGADLRGANLTRSHLYRTDLRGANLRGAVLQDAVMIEVDLRDGAMANKGSDGELKVIGFEPGPADMCSTVLVRADMARAKLSGSFASGADFSHSKLSDARLVRTDLRNSKFVGANLSGADFSGADLRGADMTGATTTGTVLRTAIRSDADAVAHQINPLPLPVEHKEPEPAPAAALDLEGMLVAHVKWLKNGGKEGTQLNLVGMDLDGADLRNRVLSLGIASVRGAKPRAKKKIVNFPVIMEHF
jgi:uncharacterized protein YjbI with pentapeptide repeats